MHGNKSREKERGHTMLTRGCHAAAGVTHHHGSSTETARKETSRERAEKEPTNRERTKKERYKDGY